MTILWLDSDEAYPVYSVSTEPSGRYFTSAYVPTDAAIYRGDDLWQVIDPPIHLSEEQMDDWKKAEAAYDKWQSYFHSIAPWRQS